MRLVVAIAPLLVLGATVARAQPTPTTSEFTVNAGTQGPQRFPQACMHADGAFVVTWEDGRADASGIEDSIDEYETAVLVRHFAPGGAPLGGDQLVNTYTTGRQGQPSVACRDDGSFIVAWTEDLEYGPLHKGHRAVMVRQYDDQGMEYAPPFTLGQLDQGQVCRGPDDGFVVVWNTATLTLARQFDATGAAMGTNIPVPNGEQPRCCGSDDGFVISWYADAQGGADVFAQRFLDDGTPAGSVFTVNTYTSDHQAAQSVACNDAGDFVVVWESFTQGSGASPTSQDGDDRGIFGRAFSRTGAISVEFQVNSATAGSQHDSSIGIDGAGHFVVAWTDDPSGAGVGVEDETIRAQAFVASGNKLGTEFQVNAYTLRNATAPSVAMRATPKASGDLLFAWHTSNDGDDHSIAGRMYAANAPTTTTTTLPAAAPCGDPAPPQGIATASAIVAASITASDALYTLGAAVGLQACQPCICDVDGSGTISATDALIVLKLAVGIPIPLDCPAC